MSRSAEFHVRVKLGGLFIKVLVEMRRKYMMNRFIVLKINGPHSRIFGLTLEPGITRYPWLFVFHPIVTETTVKQLLQPRVLAAKLSGGTKQSLKLIIYKTFLLETGLFNKKFY